MSKEEAYHHRIESLFDQPEPTQPAPAGAISLGRTPNSAAETTGANGSPAVGDYLALMAEIGRLAANAGASEHGVTALVQRLAEGLNADLVQLYVLDESGRTLERLAAVGDQSLAHAGRLPVNANTLVGLAAAERKACTWEAAGGQVLPAPPATATQVGWALPLAFNGRVLGVLDLQRAQAGNFSALEQMTAAAAAAQAAGLLETVRLQRAADQARSATEVAVSQRQRSGWDAYLDGIQRRERLGFAFDQREVTALESQPKPRPGAAAFSAPLALGGMNIGALALERAPAGGSAGDAAPAWSAEEARLISAIGDRVTRQVENLRLLDQAERYRQDAETAARRLTRQGWESFLDAIDRAEQLGFSYDHLEVTPIEEAPATGAQRVNLQASGASLGALFVETLDNAPLAGEQARLAGTVAELVGQHIENLRLLAQAEKYRQEAEQAAKRMTLEAWENYERQSPVLSGGYAYNQKRVTKVNPQTDWPVGAPQNGSNGTVGAALRVREQSIGRVVVEAAAAPAVQPALLVEAVADRLGAHIENLRLLDETEQARQQLNKRAAELETVAKVSTAAASILSPDELLQTVVDLTKSSFKLYHVGVFLLEEDGQTLKMAAGAGEVGRQMMVKDVRIPISRAPSIIARAGRDGAGVIVSDVTAAGDFWPHPLLPDTRSELAVPMIVGRRMIGVFDVQSVTPGRFQDEDLRTYATLASQAAVALQNAELYAEQAVTVERLRELDHLKSAFLANMSHELRTPLNSILGFTQVVLEGIDGPLTDNMHMDLELIEKNGKHLLNLINEVLDYAKIEAGRMAMAMEPLDFRELLEDVIVTTRSLAREKSLAMRIENGPGMARNPLPISGDQMRLRQVLLNLVGNAIKFTDHGGVTIEVCRFVQREKQQYFQMRVRDTGIGIPPNKLESIFEAFSQVDTSTVRKSGGTGLGLPISRRLVEMHGGRLWAESRGVPGEGSELCLELPVRRADHEEITSVIH